MNHRRNGGWWLLVVLPLVLAACSSGQTNPPRPPETHVVPPPITPALLSRPTYYEDGIPLKAGQPDFTKDVKEVTPDGSTQIFVDHPHGYSLKVSSDMAFDFRYSPAFVRISRSNLDIKVSRERSPYKEMEMYFADYLDRFVGNAKFRESNQIKLVDDTWKEINGFRTRIISVARTPAPGSTEKQNEYLFAYLITEDQEFYNFFFRTDSLVNHRQEIEQVLQSFSRVPPKGKAVLNVDFHPVKPTWNDETAAYYQKLQEGKTIQWGIFSPWAVTKDYSRIAQIEAKLDFRFPIVLHYLYLSHPFPTEGMEQAYKRGQVVELTMQVAEGNNDGEPRRNANFGVLDGTYDKEIRQFAQAAKGFKHPFIFRLNNEMNTDWSQYSGLLTLSDADIYIKVWQRIYRIFGEEGVNNAIWVFNPHDRSYPPTNWNDQVSFYPGNEYVHMLGLTGYNNGTYFQDVTGERWRSFKEVYAPMVEEYRPIYGRFPWMITEFASSSVGGDKAAWIREMFQELPKIPEIKAALWWSHADYDYREGKEKIPGRRYWLDETDQYLQVFKEGLRAQKLVK